MPDYSQYPSQTPRGRHAKAASGQSTQAGTTPQGAFRPASPDAQSAAAPYRRTQNGYRPVQGGQRPAGGYQPGQGAQRQQGYQPMQNQNQRQANGKPPRKKGGPWRVVFYVALAVLVAALIALGAIAYSYWQGQSSYDKVADQTVQIPDDIKSLDQVSIDWDALRAANKDVVGWIYIPDTAVNYPIVQSADDSYYLTHDFQGSEGWIATFGAIFLAAQNAADFSDANNIIYGHHLNNGSMFAAIAGFDDAATFNAHRTVYLFTPSASYKLSTFSLVHCAADDALVQTAFADDAERTAYVQDKMDRSVVTPSGTLPAAKEVTRMFALATCDNLPSDGRYVLFCSIEESSASTAALSDVMSGEGAAAVNDASKEMA